MKTNNLLSVQMYIGKEPKMEPRPMWMEISELERKGDSKNLVVSYIGYMTEVTPVDEKDDAMQIILKVRSPWMRSWLVSARWEPSLPVRAYCKLRKLRTMRFAVRPAVIWRRALETNPSVDVSYSDAATGARQIKLLGLAGTYVQMLTENYPNFRGAASLYGLDYVPGAWMESIQVS